MKVGLAEFEIRNEHGEYVLHVGGYGRTLERVGVFDGARQASLARAAISRGVADVAPIIWETGEEQA